MPGRIFELDGRRWEVTPAGRRTVYSRDEFAVVFTSHDDAREQRVSRYAPLGVKSPELSLARLSDRELRALLRSSQPAWTSPELGYGR